MSVFDDIKDLSGVAYRWKEGVSTYKGGGKCRVFQPENMAQFEAVVGASYATYQAPFLLGGGSNVIVADGLAERVGISTRRLDKIALVSIDEENKIGYVFVECGATLSQVTKFARQHSLGGLEFLWGVPCTVGGAIKMNAGAFSSKMSDYVHKVDILSADCANWYKFCKGALSLCTTTLYKDEIDWGYRKGVQAVVRSAILALPFVDADRSCKLAMEYLRTRRAKQPLLPSVGSVFENGEVASGKLIDECGLKGLRVGGAQISPLHANFIVNVGGGSASDFLRLVGICEEEVYCNFGTKLKREFCLLC